MGEAEDKAKDQQPVKKNPLNQIPTQAEHQEAPRNITDNWCRAVLQNITEGFLLCDVQGKILYANDAFCRMTGYSYDELITMWINDIDVGMAEAPEKSEQMILRAKELGGVTNEVCHRRKDGQIIDVLINLRYLDIGSGLFFCFHRDITEQKEVYRQLKESEERYRALIDLDAEVGVAVVMLHDTEQGEGIQTFISDEWSRITGYSKGELLGMSFFDLLHSGHRKASLIRHRRKVNGESIPDHFEMSVIRKDGTEVPIELTSAYTIYQGKRVNVAYIRDITERIEAKAQLITYQKELRSLASQLSLAEEHGRRRIAGELHDRISQTLATCNIKLGAMIESAPSIRLTEPIVEIQTLIKNLIKEIRSLTFELSSPILYEIGIEAALEHLTEQIQEKHGILVKFEDDGQPKPLCEDVSMLLFQMVRELLVNVVKHAQARNVTVSIEKQDNNIRITVEDDGVGFDVKKKRSFGREDKGFGLFSIRERLHHINGSSSIESQPGRGTQVILILPLEGQ